MMFPGGPGPLGFMFPRWKQFESSREGTQVGFPKIPDPQEIADMTAKSMEPMMDLLTEIRDLIQEQNKMLAQRGAA